jgi:hypothetical protein
MGLGIKCFETEPTEWLGFDGRCRGWLRTITLMQVFIENLY